MVGKSHSIPLHTLDLAVELVDEMSRVALDEAETDTAGGEWRAEVLDLLGSMRIELGRLVGSHVVERGRRSSIVERSAPLLQPRLE
jgi:hypothetical protein